MLHFSDGVKIDTSGELRKLTLPDGLYVVGKGYCVAVNDDQDAKDLIAKLKKPNLPEAN